MTNTIHEIHTQYKALKTTRQLIDAQFGGASALLMGTARLVFIGSGSSYTIAKSGALMAQLKLGIQAIALPAGDLLLHISTYRPLLEDAALIVLTRSGETTEIVRAVLALRELGVRFKLLTISCVKGSTMSGMSDFALELPWAFDQSVCQTRTVTNLYFCCAYLLSLLAGDEALIADLVKTIERGSEYMARIECELKDIARLPWTHAVVLGDAELGGLCDEAALTFKEICQLPSNYYHLLDVRHGPMVLIKEDTLVVAVLSDAENELELGLVRDAVHKGATVITYSDLKLDLPGVTSIHFGEPLAHPARGIPVIAICQLLSFHKSFLTGADPDRPDGLSAWIEL